jgi:hypothetical protein
MSIKQNTVPKKKNFIKTQTRKIPRNAKKYIESFENWIRKNNKPHSNQKRNCSIYIHVIYRIRIGMIINDEIFFHSFSRTSHPLTFHFLFTFTFFIHFVRIYVTGKVNQQRQCRRNKKNLVAVFLDSCSLFCGIFFFFCALFGKCSEGNQIVWLGSWLAVLLTRRLG